MKKYTELDSQIISLYQVNKSMKEVGRQLSIDPQVVKRVLKENNVELRIENYRKHKLNDHFFDSIDTEEKAYMLGFLFADGSVRKDYYNVTLTLSSKDIAILRRFVEFIFIDILSEHIITFTSKQAPYNNYSRIEINNKYLVGKLIELGCTPAKSLTLRFPRQLIDEIICRHFIRGYFDGDGSITQKDRTLTITSTFDFCDMTRTIIKKYTDIDIHIYKKKDENVYRGVIHGRNKVLKILEWLYKDATIYLSRKYDIFQAIYNEPTKYFSEEEIEGFITYRNNGLTYKKIADIYDYSDTGVRKAIKRKIS